MDLRAVINRTYAIEEFIPWICPMCGWDSDPKHYSTVDECSDCGHKYPAHRVTPENTPPRPMRIRKLKW